MNRLFPVADERVRGPPSPPPPSSSTVITFQDIPDPEERYGIVPSLLLLEIFHKNSRHKNKHIDYGSIVIRRVDLHDKGC